MLLILSNLTVAVKWPLSSNRDLRTQMTKRLIKLSLPRQMLSWHLIPCSQQFSKMEVQYLVITRCHTDIDFSNGEISKITNTVQS